MNYFRTSIVFSILISLSLLFFSYTQVDLNLTLSQQSIAKDIQSVFQHVGFYQRPIATVWFLGNVLGLCIQFFLLLYAVYNNKINRKQLYIIIGITTFVVFFSFPAAFSYDIFNYIFTAKTVVLYKTNPYAMTPLHFQGIDSMLSFMRWTHLPSAYPPLWIILTIPLYLFSFNSLLLSLFTIKMIAVSSYIVSIHVINSILMIKDKKHALLGTVLFALNPLIIIECVVSGHNDIVMMMFALLSYHFYLLHKKYTALFFLALSVAIKLMTFPLIFLLFIGWKRWLAVGALLTGLGAVLLRREFLPWYFVWIIPFSSLIPNARVLQIIIFFVSVGLVLSYSPLLYIGTYTARGLSIQQSLIYGFFTLGIVISLGILLRKRVIS